jgi:hypothetical protein
MGAISTPIWNFINFDPRIQPVDDSITWPIPGGYSYGPDRTATVSYFEEIPVNQLLISLSPPPSSSRGEEKPANLALPGPTRPGTGGRDRGR